MRTASLHGEGRKLTDGNAHEHGEAAALQRLVTIM